MLIRRKPAWAIPEALATPEGAYLNRRDLVAGLGLGAGLALAARIPGARAEEPSPIADLFPARRNEAYAIDRPLTPEEANATYNNFYEFGSQKNVAAEAQALEARPWTVTVDGMVEEEKQVDVDQLIRAMPVEERLYRHRCVEAWSMTVPWTGFPLKALLDWARPLSSAAYVRFETFMDPEVAPGQRQVWYPWPYVEGLTMAEAANDLSFMVIGAYGRTLVDQHGAPLRLATPWKYGFKSIKSIARITFTDERPVSFWEATGPSEYGFWANVNPDVPHPRWSQATERVLHTGERVPTIIYNGYGEQVAHLYKDLADEPLFM